MFQRYPKIIINVHMHNCKIHNMKLLELLCENAQPLKYAHFGAVFQVIFNLYYYY